MLWLNKSVSFAMEELWATFFLSFCLFSSIWRRAASISCPSYREMGVAVSGVAAVETATHTFSDNGFENAQKNLKLKKKLLLKQLNM